MVLTCTFPTPLVEWFRGDLLWHRVWPRLQGPSLEAVEVDLLYSLIHGLPDVQANRHHWGAVPSPACLTCQPQAASETILRFFTSCSRTSAAWHLLYLTLGVAHTAETLLFLAWPPTAARSDAAVVLAVTTFTGPPGPPGQGLHGRQGRPIFSIL
jgi:hypothetical protein